MELGASRGEIVWMRITPYGERWVESQHARTNLAVVHAHRHSVVFVNNTRRWPEFEAEVTTEPAKSKALSDRIDEIPSAKFALQKVGLAMHAGMQRDVATGAKPRVERVFFSADDWPMYTHTQVHWCEDSSGDNAFLWQACC